MIKLDVPYVKQINDSACGAACLEMIFRFYGIEDFSQEEFYKRVKSQTSDGENIEIKTDELVNEAKKRGFYSDNKQIIDLSDSKKIMEFIGDLLQKNSPFIVCQQWPRNPKYGHFRVVVGIDLRKEIVIYHDPFFGEEIKVNIHKFISDWEKVENGNSVIGGQFICVSKKG